LLGALRRASGLIRREVTRRLRLRFAPELRFLYDDGIDATSRIEELLNEIRTERKPG
jgi:ribosome-binding factor A